MPQSNQRWTAAMVRELPDDGKRYEVIDGELLVTPSPARVHQRAVGVLGYLLFSYLEPLGIGEVLASPADLELDPHGLVQPDLFVQGLVGGKLSRRWNDGAPLMLVIEVLSPGTARADRTTKRLRFQRAGIPEYWIVDLDARVIERWRPADDRPEVNAGSITWQPAGVTEPLRVNLSDYFRRVCGD